MWYNKPMNKLESQLATLGYEYEEVAESIYLVSNFLSDEEISEVMGTVNSASEKDWETHYMNGVIGLAKRKYGREDLDNLIAEGLVEITEHWLDKNLGLPFKISGPLSERISKIVEFDSSLQFDGVGTIQRQYAGAFLKAHVDNHADPKIEYAVIMYINDDYTDGELFFSNLNFEIKPPAKSLIIFPSGELYLHGVKAPGDGPFRYVLPSFVRKNQDDRKA
jgi:hypothetical protein